MLKATAKSGERSGRGHKKQMSRGPTLGDIVVDQAKVALVTMAPPKGFPKPPTSGRRKGVTNNKVTIIKPNGKPAVEVYIGPQTPKEVLLDCMTYFMRKSRQVKKIAQATDLRLNAMAAARFAAPYCHPRLSAVWLQGDKLERFVIRAPELITDAGEWERLAGPRLEAEAEDDAPEWAK